MKEGLEIVVVGGGYSYYSPFANLGKQANEAMLHEDPELVGLVVFTGGEDVSPHLYGESPGSFTWATQERDEYEMAAFKKALAHHIPMVGICRGAQFLCVMAGGKLVQHLRNHGQYHDVRMEDGREINLSSTHHQMMLPPENAKVLGWASPSLSPIYLGADDVDIEPSPQKEIEIVHFPAIRAVGMQYHPEMMRKNEEGFVLASDLVSELLLK